MPKRRYSAFFGTDLDLHLRERHIATVLVTGVVTNICVRSTVGTGFLVRVVVCKRNGVKPMLCWLDK